MKGLFKGLRYRFCIKQKRSCYRSALPYSCVDMVASSGKKDPETSRAKISEVKMGFYRPPKNIKLNHLFEAKQKQHESDCEWTGAKIIITPYVGSFEMKFTNDVGKCNSLIAEVDGI